MKKLALFLLIILSIQSAIAQNTLDNVGLDNSVPSAAAYSLRKLSSSYSGNAIQVRRSSDNTTQNIGFDSNGNLDANSLTSFVGAGDGFVSIWFDQSGNGNNAVQNTLLNQPKIITSGVIEMANGLPSIIFSGSHFLVTTSTVFNNDLTGCLVYKASSSNASSGTANTWYRMNGIFGSEQPGGTTDFAYGIYNNKFTAGNGPSDNSLAGNTTVNDNAMRLHSWTRNRTTGEINLYANGIIEGTANRNTGTFSAATSVAIGANQTFSGGQVFYNGYVSELILFASILTNPRQTIENNQGLYYGICTLVATQPSANNQSVILGGTPTSLSVLSSDPSATYQWYSNTVKSNSGGTMLNGETGTTYTPNTTVEGTLYYYAVITKATTACTSNVSGYVRVGIEITSQPPTTSQAVLKDSPATALSITATGANITYQWYKNTVNNNTTGTLISGATTNTYTPPTTDLGVSYYYVVVSGLNTVLTSNASGAIEVLATLPTIWNGPAITFTKLAGADHTLEANQDFITSNVTITRGNSFFDGLFNITKESAYSSTLSVDDTEWALVSSNNLTISEINNQYFRTFRIATRFTSGTRITLNRYFLVHLITDNIYLYIKILSWDASGGFSYERSTNPVQATVVTKSGESASPKTTTVDKNGALNTTKGVTKNGEIKTTKEN